MTSKVSILEKSHQVYVDDICKSLEYGKCNFFFKKKARNSKVKAVMTWLANLFTRFFATWCKRLRLVEEMVISSKEVDHRRG